MNHRELESQMVDRIMSAPDADVMKTTALAYIADRRRPSGRLRCLQVIYAMEDRAEGTDWSHMWLYDLPDAILHRLACDVAGRLLRLRWQRYDPESATWRALGAKRLWIAGRSTDEDLRTAARAARQFAHTRGETAINDALHELFTWLSRAALSVRPEKIHAAHAPEWAWVRARLTALCWQYINGRIS